MPPAFDLPHRQRLAAQPPVHESFPLRFSDGTVWRELTGYCATCGEPIADLLLRGEVCATFTDIYHVQAIGLCPDCQVVTCFDWHLKPTGICGYNRAGQWVHWTSTPASRWERCQTFFRKLLKLT